MRYSTTGETVLRNVQPFFAELDGGGFAVGHNGNLTNGLSFGAAVRDGALMQSTTDTEVILHLVARARRNRFIDRFIEGLRQLEGAYAFVGLTNKKLVGARDPLGIRPLVIGRLDGSRSWPRRPARSILSAPNTCAMWRMARSSCSTRRECIRTSRFHPWPPRPCIFEYIYFARPDSIVGGRPVYDVRKTMGADSRARRLPPPTWSSQCRIRACRLQSAMPRHRPFPMSSVSSAITMSGAPSSSPPSTSVSSACASSTAPTVPLSRAGESCLSTTSIVRGTTSLKIVQMMRDAGAKEVHFRIASPPITHPDYYGIDTPERENLLAATHDLEGMRRFIGADSLAFLSVEGIYRAMGYERRDPLRPQFTDHCFTGDYPTALTDQAAHDTARGNCHC